MLAMLLPVLSIVPADRKADNSADVCSNTPVTLVGDSLSIAPVQPGGMRAVKMLLLILLRGSVEARQASVDRPPLPSKPRVSAPTTSSSRCTCRAVRRRFRKAADRAAPAFRLLEPRPAT